MKANRTRPATEDFRIFAKRRLSGAVIEFRYNDWAYRKQFLGHESPVDYSLQAWKENRRAFFKRGMI